MKKIISGREINTEITRIKQEVNNNCIQINRIFNPNDALDNTVNLGINWSSPGTMTVEETQEFINDLQRAIDAVKTFKYQGCEESYE